MRKFKHWIFASQVIIYSDHNPLSFLTETAPKSAKLMRWALALQEFDIIFNFRSGNLNEAADCISRMVSYQDEGDQSNGAGLH